MVDVKSQKDCQNKIVWLVQEDEVFSVKSAYDVLQSSTSFVPCLALKILWDIKVIPNVFSLSWRILRGKVSMRVLEEESSFPP